MKYLQGYPAQIISQAQQLLDEGKLGQYLARKYPEKNPHNSDKALYEFVMTMKNRYMRKSAHLSRICYDKSIRRVDQALGMHMRISRNQGGRLQAKQEIRIAEMFKTAPLGLLEMIVAHELSHLKEADHNKAFYQLCCHMVPDYHQRELDTRLYLHWIESQ
uniref:M48 metallopeptidase family protein n=1 Tax=Thaumasiovibrio occultus TaxID=1891184 RepID=UPI000B35B19F|nr:YgjP-like metallopeptidase domain-containing protein [Thaumasiovibrio occultus]